VKLLFFQCSMLECLRYLYNHEVTMPIYEYRCNTCKQRVSIFTRSIGQASTPICDRCNSTDLLRLISRFAIHKSWGESLDWAPSFDGMDDMDENADPGAMADWLRRMKHEMGETTPEFDEMIDMVEDEQAPNDDFGDDDEL
jgi:putative FmdB family regulatory protein